MFNCIFIFICSFSLFVSEDVLFPMGKDSKLGQHICRYTEYLEDHKSKTYVKPCEEGKYCVSTNFKMSGNEDYYVCKNYTIQYQIKVYNEECTSDFECDTGLKCKSSKCTSEVCTDNNKKPYKTKLNSWSWKDNELPNQNFYYYCYNFVSTFSASCSSSFNGNPDYLKLEGIINLEDYTAPESNKGKVYRVKSRESSYIGSVQDGTFVTNYKACKSGFALYFYPEKSLNDPYTGTSSPNSMYLMCVSLKSYNSNKNIYIYNINGGEDKIYNARQGIVNQDSFSASPSFIISNNYLVELELFKK